MAPRQKNPDDAGVAHCCFASRWILQALAFTSGHFVYLIAAAAQ
jgi:hypothetical protein